MGMTTIENNDIVCNTQVTKPDIVNENSQQRKDIKVEINDETEVTKIDAQNVIAREKLTAAMWQLIETPLPMEERSVAALMYNYGKYMSEGRRYVNVNTIGKSFDDKANLNCK